MSLHDHYRDQVLQFVSVCHKLSERMYVTGYGGNCAWKLEDDVILITPTMMNKGDIQAEDVVFIRTDGSVIEGRRRPTGETPMYVNFFRERPDVRSVVHCHPTYTNAFAITKGKNWLMRPLFPETITEVGPVPVVPYGEPLTQRLADNFLPFLKKYNAFLMENHGLVIMSRFDINWTMMNTELLEMTSMHILHALPLGDIKEISRDDIRNMDNVMRARKLPFMGAEGVHQSLVDVYDWNDA
ncbi:MAG TPA: class II aldolase/adducin family protein [Kiritimatiellia bacterium]|nr:class II aldolase/adducin family protein [Kiritimatiellia bacterium]HMO99687.1 class II aldolase/adducin family protein [Kiritimatiellia bacterium]HMP96139.1 class II aldolase/adducin family protein [Kiritimatiellia bacterium]